MLNAATAENLRRKAHWADHVQMIGGVPCFSWLDLSITELCNRSGPASANHRACVFCPRIDPQFYPNQRLEMPVSVARKLADELRDLKYEGAVVLCGFGEPLLHSEIVDFVAQFGRHRLHVEVVTNGDKLKPYLVQALLAAGVSQFVVSMYDGPEQRKHFEDVFAKADCDLDHYSLRDRWHGPDQDFGLKLTNRAGTIDAGNQPPAPEDQRCWYGAYSLALDWNSDAILCVQDWNKRIKLGSANSQTLWEIWTGPIASKHRMRLIEGRRNIAPCLSCNCSGKEHGGRHAAAWRKGNDLRRL